MDDFILSKCCAGYLVCARDVLTAFTIIQHIFSKTLIYYFSTLDPNMFMIDKSHQILTVDVNDKYCMDINCLGTRNSITPPTINCDEVYVCDGYCDYEKLREKVYSKIIIQKMRDCVSICKKSPYADIMILELKNHLTYMLTDNIIYYQFISKFVKLFEIKIPRVLLLLQEKFLGKKRGIKS